MKLTTILWTVAGGTAFMFLFPNPKDSTDPPSGRSGMALYRDHETGCEYVAVRSFFTISMTPRLNRDGEPKCGGTR